jgi:hypothetical protein
VQSATPTSGDIRGDLLKVDVVLAEIFFLKFSESINIPIVQIVRFGTVGFNDEVERHSMNMTCGRYSFCLFRLQTQFRPLVASLFVSFLTATANSVDGACLDSRRAGECNSTHLFRRLKLKIDGLRCAYSSYACHALLAFVILWGVSSSALAKATVPLVVCAGDDSNGLSSTKTQFVRLELPDVIARQLAVYVGEKLAILAPRGWACRGESGPDYLRLDVYPLLGDGQQNALISEQTWVAETAMGTARVLAYGRSYFTKIVIQNDVQNFLDKSGLSLSLKNFLMPDFPEMKREYINKNLLQFETPAGKKGLEPDNEINSSLQSSGLLAIRVEDNFPYQLNILISRFSKDTSLLQKATLDFAKNCIGQDSRDYCPINEQINSGG